jgi:hypothetical protein
MVESGEVACVALVPSTKNKDAAHALEQIARRPNFHPKAYWSDLYPLNQQFLMSVFGDSIQGHLGLWHFEKQIVETLRKDHIDFKKALRELPGCIYQYNPEHEAAVINALMDGTMNGKKNSKEDIETMRRKGQFKNNYSMFMQKQYYPAEVSRQKLLEWWCNYKVIATPGRPVARG